MIMTGKVARLAYLAVVSFCLLPVVALAQEFEVDSAAWLSGCWVASSQGSTVEETWMPPGGGMMLGMSRSLRGGETVGYEFVTLRSVDGRLVYSANPSGQEPADFFVVDASDDLLRLENPRHDFPKRIDYLRVSADSLVAKVYGEIEASEPAFAVRYARLECDASDR